MREKDIYFERWENGLSAAIGEFDVAGCALRAALLSLADDWATQVSDRFPMSTLIETDFVDLLNRLRLAGVELSVASNPRVERLAEFAKSRGIGQNDLLWELSTTAFSWAENLVEGARSGTAEEIIAMMLLLSDTGQAVEDRLNEYADQRSDEAEREREGYYD